MKATCTMPSANGADNSKGKEPIGFKALVVNK